MNDILLSAAFGILGGALRFLVASLKMLPFKEKVSLSSLFLYFFILLVIGAFSGILLGFGNTVSFLAGYAAIDLMNGYYKQFSKKTIKFK